MSERHPARQRILFMAEAITLCHVARPLVLAGALPPEEFEVHFACHPRCHRLLDQQRMRVHSLESITSEQFLTRIARGSPAYEAATLAGYVEEDLRLLDAVRPDLVVGDFRLSLAASARLRDVPYATVTNAYWSPFARQPYVVPELPITRLVPVPVADPIFQVVRPFAFALHCRPMNRVLRQFDLPSLGRDLRRIYTEADYTLYADSPTLVPTTGLPSHHRYLGPILWSYPSDLPEWWDSLPSDRPAIFVSLGSSGRVDLLPTVLDGLSTLDVSVIVATSGRLRVEDAPDNCYLAEFIPAAAAAQRCDLKICHGGSRPAYVALAAGTPVLGVPSILDQHLTIRYIEQQQAGRWIRAERLSSRRVRRCVEAMMQSDTCSAGAVRLAEDFRKHDAAANFVDFVKSLPS